MTSVYTDASHRGSLVVIAAYNDDTGEAYAAVSDALEKGNNTLNGELMAIAVAAKRWPNSTIHTDSRESYLRIRSLSKSKKECAPVIDAVQEYGCNVQWVPREQNIVADWLARSPVSVEFQLTPGLSQLTVPQHQQSSNERKEQIKAASDRRIAAYQAFLDNVSVGDVREAEEWLLHWLLTDAIDKRRHEQKLLKLKQNYNQILEKYKACKSALSKVEKRLDRCLKNE